MIVRQFLLWARTAPDEARAKATSALARSYLRSDLGADDRAEMEAAFPVIARDPSPQVRLALAMALARHPLVPADIVLMLAAMDGEPGAVVLAVSPVPNPAELIEFCESGDATKCLAIASRVGLPAEVAAAVAETADARACLALIRNDSADLPGFALGRIVARFSHVPAMRDALLARPDLPAAAHQALIRAVAGMLSNFVAERQWLSPGEAARVAREACDQEAVASAQRGAADVRELVEDMKRRGQLTPALALRALLSGQMRMFIEMVSVLSGVPTDRVAAMIADRSGSTFRLLYDRLGLPRGAYVAFRTALEVVQSESYLDEEDEAVGLRRRIIDEVIGRYEVSGHTADGNRLLGVLCRWRDEAARDAPSGEGLAA